MFQHCRFIADFRCFIVAAEPFIIAPSSLIVTPLNIIGPRCFIVGSLTFIIASLNLHVEEAATQPPPLVNFHSIFFYIYLRTFFYLFSINAQAHAYTFNVKDCSFTCSNFRGQVGSVLLNVLDYSIVMS